MAMTNEATVVEIGSKPIMKNIASKHQAIIIYEYLELELIQQWGFVP